MENRFNYEDLMSLHHLLEEKHVFSGLQNLISSCTFSEKKLKKALEHLSCKIDSKKDYKIGSDFSSLFSLSSEINLRSSFEKTHFEINQNIESFKKILFEYEYEDLPLLINNEDLTSIQRTVFSWRLDVGK